MQTELQWSDAAEIDDKVAARELVDKVLTKRWPPHPRRRPMDEENRDVDERVHAKGEEIPIAEWMYSRPLISTTSVGQAQKQIYLAT